MPNSPTSARPSRSRLSRAKRLRGPRNPQATRAALVAAARLEFEEAGFDATHSNRIAQRAGFAPQTFYRHFSDKVEIFLAAYRSWVSEEWKALKTAKSPDRLAETLIRHHKQSLLFRRTLRQLALAEPRVRAARAESRLEQIERIRRRYPHLRSLSQERLARGLLVIERIADACAEGEFGDLGLPAEAGLAQLKEALGRELSQD